MSGEGDFLSRWARRKAGAECDAAPDAPPAPEPVAEAPEDERSDAEILEALGLKHPDEIGLGDDVRGFMGSGVPERLRRMALRRLWRANPVLANLDGLVDYDADYTESATAMGGAQTLYQVGKGFARAIEAAPGAMNPSESREPETPLETGADDLERPEAEPPGASQEVDSPPDAEPIHEPSRRRMSFTFDES